MVTFLKSLRRPEGDLGNGVVDPRAERASAERERATAALEALVTRAESAAEQLQSLASVTEIGTAVSAMQERFAALERQLASVEGLAGRFQAAEEAAERVAKTQTRTEAQLAHAAEDVDRLQSQMAALGHKVDTAMVLRDDLDRFLGLESPIASIRSEADGVRGQLAELTDSVGRMRAQHDDALRIHRHTTSRLETFDQDHQAAVGRLEEMERRVQTVERSLEPLGRAADSIPSVQHQLAVVKALADQVAQKTAMLEQQREAVDRAANQVSQLTRLDRELDVWLRRQEEQMKRLGGLEAKITEIQTLHTKVLSRTDELQATQQQVEEAQQAARQTLTDLREQMRKSIEGFELGSRGLDSVTERVAELRNGVKDCEARFAVLDASSQGTAAVQAQVRALATQSAELSEELRQATEATARLGSMREEAERLDTLADELSAGLRRMNEAKPEIDEVVGQLVSLKGTHEMIADGLEQMQLAYAEMTRLRQSQAETEAWLANADVWTRKVQAQVKELGAMEPAVQKIRADVDQVTSAIEGIESRRTLVDEVHRRLSELGSASTELKDRAEGLKTRMDAADGRFTQLNRQADEAERAAKVVTGVIASVGEAEQRIEAVGASVNALESRAQQLDGLEDRIRMLGQELEQRQGALDRATDHLARASTLRQEAADAAHRLEEVSRSIDSGLQSAEQRTEGLERVSIDLEARANALRSLDKQVTHFEQLLTRWDSAQAEAARALEQTLSRQAAVQALETQVKHVFELTEQTVEDVHAIGAARRDVEETRALLQDTQAQLQSASDALHGFEARRKQLERTEQRLARADALALDVRSSLETLQAQRAMLDHVMERAGALAFQVKQAEALIEALRRESTLASQVKAAVAAVREEDEEEG